MGVLAAALATACLGGQTGQPSSAECDEHELAATDAWNDTTVQAAAAAFEGTYASGLQWQVEASYSTSQTPVAFPDTAQLTIDYAGDAASLDSCRGLTLPVRVTLTTSNSGISDSAQASLSVQPSAQGLLGKLVYSSDQIKLGVVLDEAALAHAPSGSFDALDPNLPGASATFTEVP